MKDLISIIKEIVKYGLQPEIGIDNKEKDLEKHLVKLYSQCFEINYVYDETDFEDFEKSKLPDISKNVGSNFPDFGFYHTVLECHEIGEKYEAAMGDAVDDLTEIILDLLEVEWRNENNSEADAWWYFELIFHSHTQQHLLNLLNYMKSKNG